MTCSASVPCSTDQVRIRPNTQARSIDSSGGCASSASAGRCTSSRSLVACTEPRWSRSPGCYQLKSAMAWNDLFEAGGDEEFLQMYEGALAASLKSVQKERRSA